MARSKRLTTRQGVRLWTVKQSPFLQGGVPTYKFDPTDCTFNAKMAKRTAPGPFLTAPIVQDKWIPTGSTPDQLTLPKGTVIDGEFSDNMDGYQGAINLWITPEWDGDDGKTHNIYCPFGPTTIGLYKYSDNKLYWQLGVRFYGTDVSAWTAGTTYHVVARWDTKNTLDGTNYLCVTIDDVHDFGREQIPDGNVTGTMYVGGGTHSANAIIEGLTVYRRPLFDGTYGIDVGNGDEINLIHASGSGLDPCLVTGSWDVVFCLPTDSTIGEITTGTIDAWSHPHNANLLGDGGFMLDGDYSNDGWVAEGSILDAQAMATAQKIFNGGYKVGCDDQNEGLYKDYTCSAGDDFVIRAIGHSDGNSIPRVILYDQTNTVEIGKLTGSNASTRTAPDVFIFAGTAPAGCTTLRVKLINSHWPSPTENIYWHQCELLNNRFDNPSLETFTGGDPNIPTGWSNNALDAGDLESENSIVHSGSFSAQFNTTASANELVYQNIGSAAGRFHCVGALLYGDDTYGINVGLITTSQFANQNGSTNLMLATNTSASWLHKAVVLRQKGSTANAGFGSRTNDATGARYVDDVYAILLNTVTLTVTPASEANSAENGGIRVDGLDACTQPISGLGATSGKVRFGWTPRHGDGDFEKFGVASPNVCRLWKDTANYIQLYSTTGDELTLRMRIAGGAETPDTWNASGIVAGTEYLIEIEYNSTQLTASFDGTVRMTVAYGGGIDWGANIPDTAYMGSNNAETQQFDAVFAAP